MMICFFLMPAPPAPPENPNLPVNINYVYGLNEGKPQEWMPPLTYLGLLMVGLPICMFLPTHRLLGMIFRPSDARPGFAGETEGIAGRLHESEGMVP